MADKLEQSQVAAETQEVPAASDLEDGAIESNHNAEGDQSGATALADARRLLEGFDWDQLEASYATQMREFADEERRAFAEFDHWIKVFEAWAATTTNYETERAAKRLKTRAAHVQLSEERLEKKRQHYAKVVDAFRGALEMLD